MANTNVKESRIKKWWASLKAEWGKIIWLNKATVIKQTVTVLIITVIVAILITFIDRLVQGGLGVILK